MEEETQMYKRQNGEGNFSIGSSTKGCLMSCKLDYTNVEECLKVIQNILDIKKKVDNQLKLEELTK